jgi:antitoxin ParD1/3/4
MELSFHRPAGGGATPELARPIPSRAEKGYDFVERENAMSEITLDAHFDRFVEAQVQSGRFQNASAVIHAALSLLEQEEDAEASDLASAIRYALDEPGADTPAEDVFNALERRFAEDAKTDRGA